MADQNPATNGDETESGEKPKQKSGKHFIAIGVIAVLVIGALLFWWRSTFYEDTDDAQINGHLIQISSRIAGQVIADLRRRKSGGQGRRPDLRSRPQGFRGCGTAG